MKSTEDSGEGPVSLASPDPLDLLRAMLAISPEDAASAREDAAEATKAGKRPTD